ncbi:hypothetical protein D3C84_578220 [compost metagenome]
MMQLQHPLVLANLLQRCYRSVTKALIAFLQQSPQRGTLESIPYEWRDDTKSKLIKRKPRPTCDLLTLKVRQALRHVKPAISCHARQDNATEVGSPRRTTSAYVVHNYSEKNQAKTLNHQSISLAASEVLYARLAIN